MDTKGEHFFKCKKIGKSVMHTPLVNASLMALQPIAKIKGELVRKEPALRHFVRPNMKRNFNEHGDEIKRRADVLMEDPVRGIVKVLDVTHRSLKVPESKDKIGCSIKDGEKSKFIFYQKFCSFPSHVKVIPFAIDSYGAWGGEFQRFLKSECHEATCGIDQAKYNMLINQARDKITVAHARAVARVVKTGIIECVRPVERLLQCEISDYGESYQYEDSDSESGWESSSLDRSNLSYFEEEDIGEEDAESEEDSPATPPMHVVPRTVAAVGSSQKPRDGEEGDKWHKGELFDYSEDGMQDEEAEDVD